MRGHGKTQTNCLIRENLDTKDLYFNTFFLKVFDFLNLLFAEMN